jgi:putative ABC transport system permease protein
MSGNQDWLDRLYQRLLAVGYPSELRTRFEAEMLDYFRSRRRHAAHRGLAATARFWCTTLADIPATSWRERRNPRRLFRTIADDLRQAGRSLRRAPGLSATIILLVALTVGATTAMFSVTHAVLVRPLPYEDPGRLVAVWEQRLAEGVERNTVGAHEFPIWAERTTTFDALAAFTYSGSAMHLSEGGDPVELFAARVTGRFFEVMAVPPLLGRAAGPADDAPGADAVAVLGERLWRDRFLRDPAIVGRRIRLNDRPHLVIGVMPERLAFPQRGPRQPPDLWVPIAEPLYLYRGRHYLFAVGRLRSDATLAQANADLAAISATLATELPEFSRGHSARAWPLSEDRSAPARPWLLLLLAASACLALVGCANVASLLLARAERRRHDARIRLALGASRARLARERIVESLMLSLLGGLGGVVLAALAARAAPAIVPRDIWAFDTVPFDGTILAFALGLAVLTGLIFGAAPVAAERRIQVSAGPAAGRTIVRGTKGGFRGALVVAQIALALLLTSGAGLFAQSLVALRGVDPAFRTDDVLAVSLALPPSRYADATRVRQFYGDLMEAVGHLPGVEHVAAVDRVPLSGSYGAIALTVEGAPAATPGQQPLIRYRIVSDHYFGTLRIPVLEGRGFAPTDARRAVPLIRWYPQQPQPPFADAPQPMPVAVVSETMARTYWPEGAVGRRFRLLYSPWITVVGVVRDTRADSLAADLRPECYLLSTQEPNAGMSLLVAGHEPQRHVPAIRQAVLALDPLLPLGGIQTLDGLVDAAQETPAFTSALVGAFAVAALLLMICGVYGLVAYTTTARTPEIGLRMALGATRMSIRGLVLGQVLALVAAGTVIGAGASLALAPSIETMLFAVTPTDPLTLVTVVVLVAVTALAAAAIPAARATRIDPLKALRHD